MGFEVINEVLLFENKVILLHHVEPFDYNLRLTVSQNFKYTASPALFEQMENIPCSLRHNLRFECIASSER